MEKSKLYSEIYGNKCDIRKLTITMNQLCVGTAVRLISNAKLRAV